jgi:hypothetical protein
MNISGAQDPPSFLHVSPSRGRSRKQELRCEAVEDAAGFIADAGVDGRGLDDGAAGRGDPVEALALGELCDGASGGIALADAADGFKVFAGEVDVGFRPEGAKTGFVEVDAGCEIALFETEGNDAGVDEFLALDAGDDAEDGVIKRGRIGHGWPPLQMRRRRRASA